MFFFILLSIKKVNNITSCFWIGFLINIKTNKNNTILDFFFFFSYELYQCHLQCNSVVLVNLFTAVSSNGLITANKANYSLIFQCELMLPLFVSPGSSQSALGLAG